MTLAVMAATVAMVDLAAPSLVMVDLVEQVESAARAVSAVMVALVWPAQPV